ncbi:MAG: glycosyltransferase family 2 protein [Deltaproteobacteria bacterium]|nr:glycosyltransferase family 2 protein [Deltaproteobacteria bacterium]
MQGDDLYSDDIYKSIEYLFLAYFFSYNSINLLLTIISFYEVRRRVISREFEDLDVAMTSPFTPPLSIIAPAYNEEISIEESVKSFLNLQFPGIEVVIVNDGSSDATLEVVKKAFNMKRIDIDYLEQITTAPVRGYYESKSHLPEHIHRLILIDKENGGKADALNAGINASHCPYFVSIDADSVLDEDAILHAFRMALDNRNIVAIGGQIAVANGCDVHNGRITTKRVPKNGLAIFQMLEYMRAFTLGRVGLARLNALLIISGAFGIFQKKFVVKVGGYLTRRVTSKIASEYTAPNADTVCEDMEIIVRMHRYIKEKKLPSKIVFTPHPLCWTEVPESIVSLWKQRDRWQRGLMETMYYHRKMIFNKKHGSIGLFALPYFLLFELLGAPVELLGYLTLPLLFYMDNLNYSYLLMFLMVAVAYGILLSVASVVICAWPQKVAKIDGQGRSLLHFNNNHEILTLVLYGFLENLGYRQLILLSRVNGIINYCRGNKGWSKFKRKGFYSREKGLGKDAVKA